MEQDNLATEQLHLIVEHGFVELHTHQIISMTSVGAGETSGAKVQERQCWMFGHATIHDVDDHILVGQHLRELARVLLGNGPGKHAA